MTDVQVKAILAEYPAPVIAIALQEVNITDADAEAIALCGRRGLTIEAAAEEAAVSVNTMQARWSAARKKLGQAWTGKKWIEALAAATE